MKNNLSIDVVNYDDVVKSSFDNNSVIVSYKTDNDSDLSEEDKKKLEELLKLDDSELKKVLANYKEVTDENGNKINIESLKYYTVNDEGKVVSLSIDELIELLRQDSYDSPVLISENNGDDDTISSDLGYVLNSMSSIVGYIKDDGNIEYASEIGDAGLFGAVYNVLNYYKSINNTLYSNIIEEAKAVADIANTYSKIDYAASGHSNRLSSGHSSSSHSSSSKEPTSSETVNGMSADEINAYTSNLLNDTLTNGIASKFNEITSFLGNSIQAGKIGKINLGKLGETINKIVPSFKDESDKCSNMITSMDEFLTQIKSNGKLKGKSWKNVKKNINYYKSLLNLSIDSSNFLSDVINGAKQMISDFLYPDTELDDSVLPELEKTLEDIKIQISELTAKVASMRSSQKEVCSYRVNPETGLYDYSKPIGCSKYPSDAEINSVQKSVDDYTAKSIELEKKIKRIYDFATVVNNAQKMINNATEQVKSAFENPIKGTDGNQSFKANFNLDLSAFGIAEGSAVSTLLEKYIKKIDDKSEAKEDSTDKSNPNATFLQIGDYTFDTSNMSDKAINVLNDIIKSWPESMEKERYKAVEIALSLLNKGITYSMDLRHSKNKNGMPIHLDCSSFVEYCYKKAGSDIILTGRSNVYTGTFLGRYNNQFYGITDRSKLIPGDVGLWNTCLDSGGCNHAGLFLGWDSKGKEVWIEMSAMKRKGATIYVDHGKAGYEIVRRYKDYD